MANETPINVTPKEINIAVGEWYYGANVEGVDKANSAIVYSSSNPEVAVVNPTSGYIYGKSEGVATISAYDKKGGGSSGGNSGGNCDGGGTIIVGQTVKVSCIQLSTEYLTLEKGEQATVTATVYPSNATNKSLSWYRNNTSVATVSGGQVCARGNGTATITASATDGSGESAYCYVTVTQDTLVTSITVHPASMTLTVGNSAYLSATVCPSNATNKAINWYSTDPCVATVNPTSGFVMSQNPGTTRIYGVATDGSGVGDYCTVTVEPVIPVSSIQISPKEKTICVGENTNLDVIIYPCDATDQSVVWCSSNECVATVGTYTGIIHAYKEGTTTITATTVDGGYQDCATIIVRNCYDTESGEGQYLALPINQCTITAMYKEDSSPAYVHNFKTEHYGLDMYGWPSTFYASGNGTVMGVGGTSTTGVGYWVAIKYDNVYSWNMNDNAKTVIPSVIVRYFHLASMSNLSVGQSVNLDTIIGTVGKTGAWHDTMNNHLHVEVDTDVNNPCKTPSISSAAGGLASSRNDDTTIDPCFIFFIKQSGIENQTLNYDQNVCRKHPTENEFYVNENKMDRIEQQIIP